MSTPPPMRGALLYIVFNRPELVARTFEAIRAARPPRLYVSADGPRADRPDDAGRCAATRAVATAVDWPCELHTRFLDNNIGCDPGIRTAIDWFFKHEAEGIVLEEDMLPVPSFFAFVEALLDRYRDDPRIGLVSGLNLLPPAPDPATSYAFSRYFHMWGWGSWARVWHAHDPTMAAWPRARRDGVVARTLDDRAIPVRHWTRTFDRSAAMAHPTWDNAWQLSIWRQRRVNIIPTRNLVTNSGFAVAATNTHGAMPAFMRRAVPRAMPFPLVHPNEVVADPAFDAAIEREALRIGPLSEAKRTVRRVLAPAIPLVDRLRFGRAGRG